MRAQSRRLPVDLLGPVQPFGVRRTIIGQRGRSTPPRARLARISASTVVERRGHPSMQPPRARRRRRSTAHGRSREERAQLVLRNAREDGRIRDLVAVEMQDRQDDAVALWVEELVRVPAGRERPGLGFSVADDAADEQVGVVERSAIGMHERIAELAALVDRARSLRRDVARDAAGEGELPKEPPKAFLVAPDVRVDLRVGALEVGVGDERRPAVTGAGHEDRVQVVRLDRAVQVRVEEVQTRRRPPVTEEARLDVLERERLAQQWVVEQVDLSDGEVVGSSPVCVEEPELLGIDLCIGRHGREATQQALGRPGPSRAPHGRSAH